MNVLVVAWDSGGGVEVVETVVRRLVDRGHYVRALGTEGLRPGLEAAGATFRPYRYAPENDRSRPETDLVKDWEAKGPLDEFARIRDRVLFGPARQFCRDVVEELSAEPADVVVVDVLVASALCGAEAMGVPRVLLMHALYGLPRPHATPMGAGFRPARSPAGRARDRAVTGLTLRLFDTGLPALNEAREELGLTPYRHPLELFDGADRILVCTSPSYDFGAGSVPDPVRYVGPQFDDARPGAWHGPWPDTDRRPLVMVGLSSTYMDQRALLQRAADALGELPVRGLVTTGPAVDPSTIVVPRNVVVTRWVRHADVLPHCAAVVTHGGHGTVMKALRAGVPVVVAPLGRDQPDNAARVVEAGAGVRVGKNPGVRRLARAVAKAVWDPELRRGAEAMAGRLAAERDDGRVVDELEAVVAEASRAVPSEPRWRPLGARAEGAAGPAIGLPDTATRRVVEVSDGGRIELFEAGEGRPVVLLHGMGLAAPIWARQFPDLATDHRVIAVNVRGSGASAAGSGGYGLERLVDDLLEVLEATDVHDAVVVGHSVSGMVALEAAIARPQAFGRRVAGVMVVSTTGGTVPAIGSSPTKDRVFGTLAAAERRWKLSSRVPGIARAGAWFSFGRGQGTPEEKAFIRGLLTSSDPAAGPELMELTTTYDARGRLEEIGIPVRVVAGTWDSFLPIKHAALLATSIPGAQLVRFPRAGHMVMMEQPDGFNAVVRGFAADPAHGGTQAERDAAHPDELGSVVPEVEQHAVVRPGADHPFIEPMGRQRPGMRRFNGEDSGFLSLELPTQPMTSQFVVIVRPPTGPDGAPRPLTLDLLRQHMAVRLGELPSFRWRIVRVPLGLSHHVAVEDPEFSLDRHLVHVALGPDDGGDAGFARICNDLAGRCLDRSRPLWDLTLVDGLDDGRQGVVLRFHHALMDGVPTILTLSRIFSGEDHQVARPAAPWEAVPIPTRRQLVADALRAEAGIRRHLPSLLRRSWSGMRRQQAYERESTVTIPKSPQDTPACSLNDAFSTGRAHANLDLPFADVQKVKREAGVTVNQVVLALVAGGLRRYLAGIDDLPAKSLICGVPMAFDPPGTVREYGNHFINFVTSLATEIEDPWDRLQAIAGRSNAARESMEAFGGELLCEWLDQIPPLASERLIRLHVRSRKEHRDVADINVNVSLVRAVDTPWALGPAAVEGVYLQGPPNSGLGLSITILSYDDTLMVGLNACSDAVADPSVVARAMEAELADLVAAAGARSTRE